jgi:predicted N-formylglutamate amidohydrolase
MKSRAGWSVVVTCEHGGHDVPADYGEHFRGHARSLTSHRGWDPGTLRLAQLLAKRFDAPLVSATVTRLLVDLNRSPHNPRVFSPLTRGLPRSERLELLERFHAPHWDAAREAVQRGLARGRRVLHLGIHSFTPVFDGVIRRPDVALLYDPARESERALAGDWLRALASAEPGRVHRRNDPYRGSADGLTTALRKVHADARYVGIEVEVNQRHVEPNGCFPAWVADALTTSLAGALSRR